MNYSTLLATALLVFTACGRKSEPPVAAEQKPGDNPAATPLPPPPAHIAASARNAPEQSVPGEVNAFLTQQLRIFIREKGRLPESFTEFSRARLDSVPRPPEGRKWVIDTTTREVKAAPQ